VLLYRRVLVGAVGIESNNVRNPKDLRGMARNAKSMKRNNEACKGILIAPSKLPRFSFGLEFLTLSLFIHHLQQMSASSGPRFAARMASRQTPHLKLGKLVLDTQKRTNWRLFVVFENSQMDSNWSSGRKNRNWQRRVEVDPSGALKRRKLLVLLGARNGKNGAQARVGHSTGHF
jgi:hypothetical protein